MTYTEKRLEEFEDKLSGIFYSKPVNGAKCTENKQIVRAFLTTSIAQALAEERERVRERVEELTIYRNNKGVTEIEENTGYYKASEITSTLQNKPLTDKDI